MVTPEETIPYVEGYGIIHFDVTGATFEIGQITVSGMFGLPDFPSTSPVELVLLDFTVLPFSSSTIASCLVDQACYEFDLLAPTAAAQTFTQTIDVFPRATDFIRIDLVCSGGQTCNEPGRQVILGALDVQIAPFLLPEPAAISLLVLGIVALCVGRFARFARPRARDRVS